MTLFRVNHNKNYTVINNTICKDNRLSWKAKGIYLYAFSRPDDWQFHLNDLINQSIDQRDSVKAGLKELEDTGYLVRERKRESGKFSNSDWVFHEIPQIIFPQTDFPSTEKPPTENHTLLNTDIQSTDLKKQQPQPLSQKQPVVVVSSKTLERLKSLKLDEHQIEDLSNLDEVRLNLAIDFVNDPRFEVKKGIIQTLKWHIKAKVPPVHSSSQSIENSQQIEEARKYIDFVRSLGQEKSAKESEKKLVDGYIYIFTAGKWRSTKVKNTDIKELRKDIEQSRKELKK